MPGNTPGVQLSRRLASLDIMTAKLKGPLKTLITIECCDDPRGIRVCSMIPRGASLSNSYTSDRSHFSSFSVWEIKISFIFWTHFNWTQIANTNKINKMSLEIVIWTRKKKHYLNNRKKNYHSKISCKVYVTFTKCIHLKIVVKISN